MFEKLLKSDLNKYTFIYFVFYIPIFLGILPRQAVFLMLLGFVCSIARKSSEFNILLFVRLIPFFIALPIADNFDNFNIWRPILIFIFVKWWFQEKIYLSVYKSLRRKFDKFFLKNNILEIGFTLFIFWAIFSLFGAINLVDGFKKILFFVNASLIFPITYYFIKNNKDFLENIASCLLISGLIVISFGFFQQILVFIIPINVFQHFWGEIVSLNLYGKNWSKIVMNMGNTWYSYSLNSTPRLRMFSVFPDSHTMPMYLLMILPFYFFKFYKKLLKPKYLLILLLFMVSMVFSGTRGIWAAAIFSFIFFIFQYIKSKKLFPPKINLIFFLFYLIAFFGLYIIYSIPQFLSFNEGFKNDVLAQRVTSLISFDETSNKGRIDIWQKSVKSIFQNPVFGVGIGNFPQVLREPVSYAKAGSSAHNIYLNEFAETGILGGTIFLIILLEGFRRACKIFIKENQENLRVLGYFFALILVWIYGYLLTDAALLDERALLIFILILAIISALYKTGKTLSKKLL